MEVFDLGQGFYIRMHADVCVRNLTASVGVSPKLITRRYDDKSAANTFLRYYKNVLSSCFLSSSTLLSLYHLFLIICTMCPSSVY